jgi:hypothetical protein
MIVTTHVIKFMLMIWPSFQGLPEAKNLKTANSLKIFSRTTNARTEKAVS